jgi:hypothetical protein
MVATGFLAIGLSMRFRQLPSHFDRRQFIFAMIAAALPVGAAQRVNATGIPMVEFVRDLYVQQVALHAVGKPLGEAEFFALFSRELRALMHAPRPNLAREPIGRILNAFFGWGVLPGQTVELGRVIPAFGGTGGLFEVIVELTIRGEERRVVVRPVRQEGLWKIADISYGHNESLLTYYQHITGR